MSYPGEIAKTAQEKYVKLPVEIQMCRFCGKVGSEGSNSFIRLHHPIEHQAIINLIKRELLECWKVQFNLNDRLPKHICQSCYIVFDSFFSFRENYLDSQTTLCSIYEEMRKKEMQKSLSSRMDAPQENPTEEIARNEIRQRNMLFCITNDHNYLGSYNDFLKICTNDMIKQKLWKIKLKSFANINQSFERNNENFTTQPESDYEESLFTDNDQIQTDEEDENETITGSFIKEEAIESQSLFEEISDPVQLSENKFENSYTTSDSNGKVLTILYPKQAKALAVQIQRETKNQITSLVELYPKISKNHEKSAAKLNSKTQTNTSVPIEHEDIIDHIQSTIEEQQTNLIESIENDFEHFNTLKSTIIQETDDIPESIIKIQSECDEQIIDVVDYYGDDFKNTIKTEDLLKSDTNTNQLNVTIFIQDKKLETQMKSDIEKQILNLVQANRNDFDKFDAMKPSLNLDKNDCLIENSIEASVCKAEEPIEPEIQVEREEQIKDFNESSRDNFENMYIIPSATNLNISNCSFKSLINKSILPENRTTLPQILEELDDLTNCIKSDENDFENCTPLESSKFHPNKHKIKNQHLNKNFDLVKMGKKKRNPYRVPFSCKFCISDPDLLSQETCDKYPTEEAVEEHFRTEHDSEFPYSCLICKKIFKQYTTCRRHVFYTHKKPNVVCKVCGIEYPSVKISEHMERCHTIRDYNCEICHKKFKNISLTKFKYHQKWHNQQQQLKCTFCNKSFVQQSHLQEHMTQQHTKDYKIKCEICGAGFSAQFKKYVHMAKIHGQSKPIKCLYCNQRFLGYKLRVRHMIAFHDHIHNKSDDESRCLICKKVFGNERGLSIHESIGCSGATTQENTTINMYSCSNCPRQFKSKATLTRHQKYHTKEGRPFQCELCSLNYETKLDLLNHKCVQYPKKEFYLKEKTFVDETTENTRNLDDHNYSLRSNKLFEELEYFEMSKDHWLISRVKNSVNDSIHTSKKTVELMNRSDLSSFKCDEVLFSDSDGFDMKEEFINLEVPIQSLMALEKPEDIKEEIQSPMLLEKPKNTEGEIQNPMLLEKPKDTKGEIQSPMTLEKPKDTKGEIQSPMLLEKPKDTKGEIQSPMLVEKPKNTKGEIQSPMLVEKPKDAKGEIQVNTSTDEPVKSSTKSNNNECTKENEVEGPMDAEILSSDELSDIFDFMEVVKKKRMSYCCAKHAKQHSQQTYKCTFCVYDVNLLTTETESQIVYPSNVELQEHIRTQHDPDLPFSCLICKKHYRKYNACRRHVFYGHIKPTVICEICGVEWKTTKISQHILRYHTIGDYKCEICQKEFKNVSLLIFKYHQRWHDTTLQYKCDICEKIFVQPAHLKVHKMEKHTKDFNIKCENCGEGFSSQYKKHLHMTKLHGKIKPLKCNFCEQRFSSYEVRRQHMIAFHDDYGPNKNEKVKCPKCQKILRSQMGLKYHQNHGCKGKLELEYNSGKNVTCSICPRKFKTQPALTRHFKFHSTEGRPYPCDKCFLNFKTKLESVNHRCTQVGRYLQRYLD